MNEFDLVTNKVLWHILELVVDQISMFLWLIISYCLN